ncbi:MAG: ABC transporter ATP-binding protein [Methanobacteriota archaeon]
MTTLVVKGITKKYGDTTAVDDFSFDVKPGEYVTLLGPSGAGKTTLMRVISGLTRQDSGEVFIDGKNVDGLAPEKRRIAFLPQTYSLFPHMDVWDNVTFGPKAREWRKDKVEIVGREMLEMVRLFKRKDAFPRELSGGMSQRCALARALAADAQILLLDEPLRALDARLRIELRHEIKVLAKELGLTVLHVTHDQEEAMAISDRILVLRKGRLVQAGTPKEIYESPSRPFVMQFVGEANFFEGKVENEDGAWEFEADRHLEIEGIQDDYEGLGRCVAGIKAERVAVGDKKTNTAIDGKVVRRLFLGKYVMLEVETECGLLRCKMTAREAAGRDEGKTVWIHLPPEHVKLFKVPSIGLAAELEVD